jgi:UDP-N-acetyl-D-glucosamine dehydrogenase
VPPTEIQIARQRGFTATADFARVGEVDAILICVPTPLDEHRQPDLSYVTSTIE